MVHLIFTRLVGVIVLTGIFFISAQYGYLDAVRSMAASARSSPKQIFIQNALNHDISGPYNGSHLQDLCAHTKWRPGLIFSCGRIYGGIGNVRNIMLNCVRFAIEAGAEFVVPPIEARGTVDIAQLEGNGNIEFSSMFDAEHFIKTLMTDCPQMKLYQSQNNLWDKPSSAIAFEISPRELKSGRLWHHTMQRPEDFRSAFDGWLKEKLIEHPLLRGPSPENPVRVEVIFPLLHWRTTSDTIGLRHNFGRMLRFPLAIRELSAKVLWEMSQQKGVQLQLEGITPRAFMGAHLRTEKDAGDAGMSSYDQQSRFLLDRAVEQNYSLVYVASGNPADTSRLRQDGWASRDLTVMTKFDLLPREDIRVLEQLRWDQQALVDFGVMMRSSFFAGTDESSFSFQIAVSRHEVSERTNHLVSEHGITFEDEFTWLSGHMGDRGYFVVGLWP